MKAVATVVAVGAVLGGIAAAGPARAADASPVRAAAQRLVHDGEPGVIVLTRRGGTVRETAYGRAEVASREPMRATDRVRIGSITKSFTATVVLQLVAEHRLALTDTVEQRLPGVVDRNGNLGARITVHQLLQHTSGLFDYTNDPRLQQPRPLWTPRALVDLATSHRPLYPAGTPGKWNYSNTNYVLLGMMIEKITGRSAPAVITDRIIRPLGLWHTTFPVADPQIAGPHAHGYVDGQDVTTAITPSAAWTAGGIVSTVDDVARFHRALITGRLLPAAQQRELLATVRSDDGGVVPDRYGLGVYRARLSCGTAWGHDGTFPGYRTWSLVSRDGRRQAVVTMNESGEKHADTDPTFRRDMRAMLVAAYCG